MTDNFNPRIRRFDKNGVFITRWGSYGTGDGQFDSSSGVAIDFNSEVYIAGSGNHRIQKFKQFKGITYYFRKVLGGRPCIRRIIKDLVFQDGVRVYLRNNVRQRVATNDMNFLCQMKRGGHVQGLYLYS